MWHESGLIENVTAAFFKTYMCNKSLRVISECLLFLSVFSRVLFASNYTETHYLEDGSAVTASHNFTVCFKLLFISCFVIKADTVNRRS